MNSEASFAMGLSLPTTWAVRPVPFENTQFPIRFVTEPHLITSAKIQNQIEHTK